MADTYSDSLRLRLQESGANDSSWGSLLNTTIQMIEAGIAGRAAVTHDDTANYTLTTANGSTDEARCMILNIGGALSAARNVVCPTKAKVYVVKNATTGGFAVTVKTTAGTGVSVPDGSTVILMCDGTNVVSAMDSFTGLTTADSPQFTAVNIGHATDTTLTRVSAGVVAVEGATVLVSGGALGTPASGVGTNLTGTAAGLTAGAASAVAIGGVTGLGTGVATALAVNVGSAGAPVVLNGALGTPSSGTLTNATGLPAAGVTGTAAVLGANTFTGQQTFAETADTVYTISDGAAFEIDPVNGNIQVITLGASRTPAATNFATGQCVLLGIDDGTAYAVTWTTVAVTWVKVGGTASAPTLATSGYTWIMLWKVGATIYGCEVGSP